MKRLSVKEKHIYVTQGLQRQGASKKDFQYSEAIDIALIKAESRIIKDRLFPDPNVPFKFEINEKYVSDIQSIIKRNYELVTFSQNNNESYGVLPYDFGYLISDHSNIIEDCKTEFTTPVPTESKTERVIVIPFTSAKGSAPYFQQVIVKILFSSQTLNFSGYQTLYEKTSIVDNIINSFKDLGSIVYWETYKDIYRPDSFLLPTLDLFLTATINVDTGVDTVTNNIDKTVTTFKSSLVTNNIILNRDVKADFLDSAAVSFYNQSNPDSPLSSLYDNKIFVKGTERFLVNKIFINYIRTPRRISLNLNQNSELSGTVHEEICDLAIQLLKKQIEDESYIKEVQDNKNRIET